MSELWRARDAVKRAVLELVAHEYSDDESSSATPHHEYLSDRLDDALKRYSELLFLQIEINRIKENLDKVEKGGCLPLNFVVDTTEEPRIQYVPYFDPRMPA